MKKADVGITIVVYGQILSKLRTKNEQNWSVCVANLISINL